MPHYWIEMGQGLLTDISKVQISSGTFYTCSAIVFYGRQQPKQCGFYHFPAGGLSGTHPRLVTATLRAMALQSEATDVVMVKAGGSGSFMMGTPDSDVEDLREFFSGIQGVTFSVNAEDTPAWVGLDDTGIHVRRPERTWPSQTSVSEYVAQGQNDDSLIGVNVIDGFGTRVFGVDLEHNNIPDLVPPKEKGKTHGSGGIRGFFARLKSWKK